MPAAADVADSFKEPTYTRFLFRAPSFGICLAYAVVAAGVAAVVAAFPAVGGLGIVPVFALVFLVPALVSIFVTPPVATALGGRISLRRSALLAATSLITTILLGAIERVVAVAAPAVLPGPGPLLLAFAGPLLWFRQMSLFGLSRPEHARSLPAALVQPVLVIAFVFVLVPPTATLLVEAGLFLVLGFLTTALLLRAADRPMRREFAHSGVAMIRPVLDHISDRDPGATAELERFFAQFSVPANLRVMLVAVRSGGRTKATLALPTVHPGPFAALGASDLPRKLSERLGPDAGVVFVPHTPCNHDLDLPDAAEFEKVATAAAALSRSLPTDGSAVASPFVSPSDGSLARAQRLGDAVVVTVTQAPDPTDDIDFAVVDPLVRARRTVGPALALIDAHNSYVEGEGDLTYATPKAAQLVADVEAAAAAANAAAVPDGFRFGVAARTDYSLRRHGIGPTGIRAWVMEVGGRTSAHVLIDGNNLLKGARAPILEALRGVVDDAEVMTTDNHVVHEVDGGINPVGERYPPSAIAGDVRTLVQQAIADLAPATAVSGTVDVPSVRVLQPAWTQRLLTSLGDTVSVFANSFLTTYLLLLTSSLVVLLGAR